MRKRERGFTLVEIMVVIVIIGIIAAIAITQIAGRSDVAKVAATKGMIATVCQGIDLFRLDHNRYPEKLEDLVRQPSYIDPAKWKTSYLKKDPEDAFGNPFVYRVPGTNGQPYDVLSLGADGKEGGQGYDEDLWNHDAWKK